MKKDEINSKDNTVRLLAPYLNLGFQLVTPILLGALLGWWIDKGKPGTPLWTLILSVLGIIIGFYSFFKTVLLEDKKREKEERMRK
ncbi:MAG: AtpZ/AtpI family protein [Candidatus Kapabacteria bacterium]|nr:AtpZ/AtpI family protein [Candidatus Kapabacteria bacterium]